MNIIKLKSLYYLNLIVLSCIFISCGSDKNNNNNNFNNNLEVNVTSLVNMTKAVRNKEWSWGCEEYNKTDKKRKSVDCTYRHEINKKNSHKFASSVKYNDTKKATQKGASGDDGTKYYIHVQAKSKSNIVSKVKSVYALLDTTPPKAPQSSNVKAPINNSSGKTFKVTVNNLKKGDTVTIYVEGGSSSSNFLGLRFLASLFSRRNTEGGNCRDGNAVGKATVSSGTSVTVDVTAKEGTNSYYAQIVDEAGNRSPCSEVFDHTNTGGILEVTKIATDKNPRRFKSWEWSCSTESTLPCEYRHVLNQKISHTFDSKATYSANNRANTSGKADGRWFLHVQAKNSKRESNIKSVFVRIDKTKPETPNTDSVKVTLLNRQTHSLRVTFRDLMQGDRVFLYNVSNCQSSSLGTTTVGDNNEGVVTLTATGSRQNYYARVIDEAGNRSGCGQVFTYPENVLPLLPTVTGLESDQTLRRVKSWQWGCTTESTHPCEYRHIINQKTTHTFASSVAYTITDRANTRGQETDGTYYLHVQAKNVAGPSEVKSVSAKIKKTPPTLDKDENLEEPVPVVNNRATRSLSVNFEELMEGDRVRIYTDSQCSSSIGSEGTVDSDGTVTIDITAKANRTTYYGKVTDRAGNRSGCTQLFTYPPEILAPRLELDDTPLANPSNNYLHDRPTFKVSNVEAGDTVLLYKLEGETECTGTECCNKNTSGIDLVASAVYPSTGGADFTIQVGDQINSNPLDESELEYPDNFVIEPEEFTFYVERKYTDEDGEEVSKCSKENNEGESTEQQNKKSVAYNLWPWQPIHVGGGTGGDPLGCLLSKEGEVSCWWYGTIFNGLEKHKNQCLPSGGRIDNNDNSDSYPNTADKLMAIFNPNQLEKKIDLGCRSGSGSDCPKYKAIALSAGGQSFWAAFGTGVPSGLGHICVLLDDQKVKCWGRNNHGQLGQDDELDKNDPAELNPINLGTNLRAKAISAGGLHTCVLLDDFDDDNADDNKIKCWGNNQHGQLGQDNTTSSDNPADIDPVVLGTDLRAKAISAGAAHTCAILDDTSGTTDDDKFKCWGYNGSNQINADRLEAGVSPSQKCSYGNGKGYKSGDNNNDDSDADTHVECDNSNGVGATVASILPMDGGKKAKAILAGAYDTCIIIKGGDDDGKLRCQGRHLFYLGRSLADTGTGEVNEGITVSSTGTAPNIYLNTITFAGDRKPTAFTLGEAVGCGLLDNGTVNCFGAKETTGGGFHPDRNLLDDLSGDRLGSGKKVKYLATANTAHCAYVEDSNANAEIKCWGRQGSTFQSPTAENNRIAPQICPLEAPTPSPTP